MILTVIIDEASLGAIGEQMPETDRDTINRETDRIASDLLTAYINEEIDHACMRHDRTLSRVIGILPLDDEGSLLITLEVS